MESPRPSAAGATGCRAARSRTARTCRALAADIPGPAPTRELDPVARVAGDDGDRRSGRRNLERVVEHVVDDLLEMAGRRERDERRRHLGGECTCAPPRTWTRPHRPSTSPTTTGDGDDRLLRPHEHEQTVDEPRQPLHLGDRALEVLGGVAATSASRNSSRSRMAASGVRS